MAVSHHCAICRFSGGDVRLDGCGCILHARCVPVNLVAEYSPSTNGFEASTTQQVCPCCQNSLVSRIHLLPLSLDGLDKAVELRKNSKSRSGKDNAKNAQFHDIEAEASYVHLSRSSGSVSASLSDKDHHRTGRWTNDEVAYTDFVVDAFDKGKLPIAQGVRLNDFLGDMLMCKGSRLTKKMKNAKLSSRSYELNVNIGSMAYESVDTGLLSSLEDRFFKSISCEATSLELRFNVTKAWRTHFSNFCVQLETSLLDAEEWVSSLEVMERRAAEAEEKIRKSRRQRMGLALKTDVKAAPKGVFFNGMPAPTRTSKGAKRGQPRPLQALSNPFPAPVKTASTRFGSSSSVTSSDDDGDADFIANILDFPENRVNPMNEDISTIFDDFNNEGTDEIVMPNQVNSSSAGPFVEELVSFMEQENLPFQHVDLWVPSITAQSGDGQEVMRLFHAGYGSRRDLDPATFYQLNEYGDYSTKFSFAVGHGLPGRVYFSDKHSWECRVHEQDTNIFERAGGAKIYGVKTGFGLPVVSDAIGRIVVVFYSLSDMRSDQSVIDTVTRGLAKYQPKPTWKLVVEMGDGKPHSTHAALPSSGSPVPQSNLHVMTVPRAVCGGPQNINQYQGRTTPAPIGLEDSHEEEQRIASLLGEHMPLSRMPIGGTSDDTNLLPYFLSLRLSLIRSPNRRTSEEAEKIDLIVKSYRGYTSGANRSEKDVVNLLVQDWRYISTSLTTSIGRDRGGSFLDAHQQQMQFMEPTPIKTVSASAMSVGPARRPQSLQFVQPPKERSVSAEDLSLSPQTKKRRVSSFDSTSMMTNPSG